MILAITPSLLDFQRLGYDVTITAVSHSKIHVLSRIRQSTDVQTPAVCQRVTHVRADCQNVIGIQARPDTMQFLDQCSWLSMLW